MEAGWECTGSSPSVCRRVGSQSKPGAPGSFHPASSSGGFFPGNVPGAGWHTGSGGSGGRSWATTVFGVLVASAMVAALAAGVYYRREAIYDAFPQVCMGKLPLAAVFSFSDCRLVLLSQFDPGAFLTELKLSYLLGRLSAERRP